MKKTLSIILLLFFAVFSNVQAQDSTQIVEASCGQCNFGMTGKAGCDLAVRIEGAPYFVDGAKIDKFGDDHATARFWTAIRKSKVSGKIKKNRFIASSFTLLPQENTD